jgi:DNA-binding NarL/FixJ family response regulator
MIVDDHAVVREGLRQVLASDPGFEVVADASSAPEAVEKARRASPDVILLDISMPGT